MDLILLGLLPLFIHCTHYPRFLLGANRSAATYKRRCNLIKLEIHLQIKSGLCFEQL